VNLYKNAIIRNVGSNNLNPKKIKTLIVTRCYYYIKLLSLVVDKMSKTVKVNAGGMIFLAETDESIEVSHVESLSGVPEGMQATVGAEKITQEFETVKHLIIVGSVAKNLAFLQNQ
jgi:hypothetical protein